MRRLTLSLACMATMLAPAGTAFSAADEQGYQPGGYSPPAGHMPPPGQCRVWFPNRPAGQQPAPTECRRAQYEAARYGGRVLYGGEPVNQRGDDDRRDQRGDRARRAERDGDDRWARVCVQRDWYGRCLRTELRRR